jgi:hypothetical protein
MSKANVHFSAVGLDFEGVAHYSHHDNGAIDLDGVAVERIEATLSSVKYAYATVQDGVWVCASEMSPAQYDSVIDQIAVYESELRSGAYNYTREEA